LRQPPGAQGKKRLDKSPELWYKYWYYIKYRKAGGNRRCLGMAVPQGRNRRCRTAVPAFSFKFLQTCILGAPRKVRNKAKSRPRRLVKSFRIKYLTFGRRCGLALFAASPANLHCLFTSQFTSRSLAALGMTKGDWPIACQQSGGLGMTAECNLTQKEGRGIACQQRLSTFTLWTLDVQEGGHIGPPHSWVQEGGHIGPPLQLPQAWVSRPPRRPRKRGRGPEARASVLSRLRMDNDLWGSPPGLRRTSRSGLGGTWTSRAGVDARPTGNCRCFKVCPGQDTTSGLRLWTWDFGLGTQLTERGAGGPTAPSPRPGRRSAPAGESPRTPG